MQYNEGIEIDNNHYIEALQLPSMEIVKNMKMDETLNGEGQTEFHSIVGKLTALANTSRPEICFDVKLLSSRYGKATKRDFLMANKRMIKVKSEKLTMRFPDLGMNIENWALVGHSDAGIKSMPDKITRVGGYVVMICNKQTDKCCILGWKSKQI